MTQRRLKQNVHILSSKVEMRFTPIKQETRLKICQKKQMPLFQKLLSYLPLPKQQKQEPIMLSSKMTSSKSIAQSKVQLKNAHAVQQQQNPCQEKLIFAFMLTSEHLMIGNSKQLDVIQVSKINTNNFVETEYLWSIRKKEKISHVCLQQKKINMLVIVCRNQVFLYNYDCKKFPSEPFNHHKQVILQQEPKFVKIVRQSNICFFFQTYIEIFVASDDVRKRFKDSYDLPKCPQSTFSLFFVPQSYQNYANIFFQENKKEQDTIFTLWCIQLQFSATDVKVQPIQKIYEIKNSLKKSLKLGNYSKQIFLLNLGSQILALKKGYVLDSATVNMKRQFSALEYVGNDNLLHISSKKIQVYMFTIDLLIKPFKISIKPIDSIKVSSLSDNQQFFRALPALTNEYILIFQTKQDKLRLKKGELRYSFYLTKSLSREEKMFQLFPYYVRKFNIEDPDFLQKEDMAEKMGYTRKQIYLELWSRSQKTSQQDYSLLLATNDYKTITDQIVRKLKKNSVHFTEIETVQKACLMMLSKVVFSTKCTFDSVVNYLHCHLFKRKLQMFRQIKTMQKFKLEQQKNEKQKQAPKMNIRQYQFYRNMELKNQLMSYINEFCHQNNSEKNQLLPNQIRFLLTNFRFPFRTVYEQILRQIIKTANNNLVHLLKEIPEILPYYHKQQSKPMYLPNNFYDGVWPQITIDQWQQNLYFDTIMTIDNKQVISQVVKSINFKRNWLYQHDLVAQWKSQIQKNQAKIRSPHIFYFFIAELFSHIEDMQVLKQIIDFLESTYTPDVFLMKNSYLLNENLSKSNISCSKNVKDVQSKIPYYPQNIRGKVFILKQIYSFFVSKNIVPLRQGRPCSLSQFLYFEDPELIHHCFEKERSIKGLLLKDIKDIYKSILGDRHLQVFNQAILNYFISDRSQISDLKYLLNRINNEPRAFHKQNRSMYAVLVEALQRKMKIGTGNDIPLDQVLVYLQNLPLTTNDQSQDCGISSIGVLNQLKAVQGINKESEYLQKSKINMSIYDILRNPEQVFTKLIQFSIKSSKPKVWQSIQNFIPFAIMKIVQVEQFGLSVYHFSNEEHEHHKVIFFLFLSKLCEQVSRIKFAKGLLEDKQIKERYEGFTSASLVQFMYKWKMHSNNCFIDNQEYILQLLTLIPEQSCTYMFIYNELAFARMLSYGFNKKITYPISETFLNNNDIKEIINDLPIQFVMQIDIHKLYEIVHRIQNIFIQEVDFQGQIIQHSRQIIVDSRCKTTLSQLYQIFVLKYLNSGKMKQVVQYINILIDLPGDENATQFDYKIIFPILYILKISGQLNQHNKENLLQCVWHYFYHPKQLMGILEHLVTAPLSPHKMKEYLEEKLQEAKQKYIGYNQKNQILNEQFLRFVGQDTVKQRKFSQIIKKSSRHIQRCKEDFKSIEFSIILIILFNEPYALSKLIQCRLESIIKPIRSILSYTILEDIVDPEKVLEAGKRIFMILLESSIKELPLQYVIQTYSLYDLNQDMEAQDFQQPQQDHELQTIMWNSAEAFRKKKQFIRVQGLEQRKNKFRKDKKQPKTIEQLFLSACGQQKSREPSNYIFQDSDNEDRSHIEVKETISRKKSKQLNIFVPKVQRNAVFQSMRLNKPAALFKPNNLTASLRRSSKNLFVSHSFKNSSNLHSQRHSEEKKKNSGISYVNSVQMKIIPDLKLKNSQQFNSDEQYDEQLQISHEQLKNQKMNTPNSPCKSSPEVSPIRSPIHRQQFSPASAQGIPKLNRIQNNDDFQNEDIPNSCFELQKHQQEIQEKQQEQQQDENSDIQQNKYVIIQNYVGDPEEDELPSLNADRRSYRSQQYEINLKNNRISDLIDKFILSNQGEEQILQNQFDYTPLKSCRNNEKDIKDLIAQLYNRNLKSYNNKNLKMIQAIVQQFQPQSINHELFKIICKIWQAQSKTIPEIPFNKLLPFKSVIKKYQSEVQIFNCLYSNLKKFVGSQNIYTVSQFVRRAFDNSKFQQQVVWGFLIDLCSKIDNIASQQRSWTLEKISATLPKVDTDVWIKHFFAFKTKVIEPQSRDQILQIFCEVLKTRTNKEQSVKFLTMVLQVYESQKIKQTLEQIQAA